MDVAEFLVHLLDLFSFDEELNVFDAFRVGSSLEFGKFLVLFGAPVVGGGTLHVTQDFLCLAVGNFALLDGRG